MARIDPQNAPYKVSRAALRERYGARSIDARAPQSPRDTTPSGREARAMQEGATQEEAAQFAADQFRQSFTPRQQIAPQPPLMNRAAIQNPQVPFNQGGLASPEDVARVRARGAEYGSFETPYGPISFGLLPETNAADLGEFLPSPGTPLTNWALPKPKSGYLGGVMKETSKWRQRI